MRRWDVAVATLLGLLAIAMTPALAAGDDESAQVQRITRFDIAPQPLEDALYAFGAATGVSVFADGGSVSGRRSSPLRGNFTVFQGLQILLGGTGLDAHLVGPRAVALSPTLVPPGELLTRQAVQHYSASLQEAALRRLCAETDSRLGTYRIAVQVWLDELGHVQRLEFLSSTGEPTRDMRIHDLIESISAGKPPAALPQPVTMVILPRSPQDSGDCAGTTPRDAPGDRKPEQQPPR